MIRGRWRHGLLGKIVAVQEAEIRHRGHNLYGRTSLFTYLSFTKTQKISTKPLTHPSSSFSSNLVLQGRSFAYTLHPLPDNLIRPQIYVHESQPPHKTPHMRIHQGMLLSQQICPPFQSSVQHPLPPRQLFRRNLHLQPPFIIIVSSFLLCHPVRRPLFYGSLAPSRQGRRQPAPGLCDRHVRSDDPLHCFTTLGPEGWVEWMIATFLLSSTQNISPRYIVMAADSQMGTPSCTMAGTRPFGFTLERKEGDFVSPAWMESWTRVQSGASRVVLELSEYSGRYVRSGVGGVVEC
jgi:hypothetical protein